MKEKMEKMEKEKTNDANATATAAQATAEELPAQISLTPEQIEELKDRASKAEEYWDRLLRQAADFENYKKRATRERQEAVKYANESLLQKLIPILDSFDMATAAAGTEPASSQSLQAGIAMVHNQLKAALAEAGLEEVNALNKTFDPNLHEAVAQRETAEAAEDQVVQQLRKGYKLRDRLIRPATVIVAKKPGA